MPDHRLHELSASDQARRRRRQRRLGLTLVLALGVAVVVLRVTGAHERADDAAQRGAQALAAAVAAESPQGRVEPLAQARASFETAARGSAFDPYPVFALELVVTLESGRAPAAKDPDVTAVLEAIAAGELADAQAALERVDDGLAQRWLGRLLRDMRP